MKDPDEGKLLHKERSPTAASVGNRLFPDSGPMLYRVTVATGLGLIPVDVTAATGDSAAEQVLAKHPGCKVASVVPAPEEAKAA